MQLLEGKLEMGYVLGWIESLAACLLLLALVTSCSAHLSRRWLQVVLPCLAAVPAALAGLGLTIGSGMLLWKAPMHSSFFLFASSWTVTFFVGAAAILRRGLRARRGIEMKDSSTNRSAAAWPSAKLAIAAGAAVLLCAMTFWNMSLAARNKLAVLRAEAGALALSVAPSRPPDPQNAALVYEKAFELIEADAAIPVYSEGADHAELRDFLDRHEPALRLLRRAAAMPGCYFDHEYAIPSALTFPHELAGMRRGARLLALDARLNATQGQSRAALEDISAMFGVARHVGAGSTLIQALLAIAIGEMGHSTLQIVLNDCDPSEADLAGLQVDEVFSYWRLFRRSMRMERAFGLSTMVEMLESTTGGMGAFFLLKELSGHRSLMLRLDQVVALPYHEAREGMDQLETEAKEGRWGMLQRLLYPSLDRSATMAAEAEARHRLGNLALAATAYRIKHGELPAKAEDLVPEFITVVPKDPFDGERMRMLATGEGILLYSIGADMKDNGGSEWNEKDETGDLTFRLKMPAKGRTRN